MACEAIPTKQGVYVEYWGGVQSGRISQTQKIYAPFTTYDSLQVQSGTVNLTPSTWRNADFPAYKMYQYDDNNNGFAVGYVIDFGKGLPTWRKDRLTGANGAGFWYGSSEKMYPHFYDVPLGADMYGESLSFCAFRAPVLLQNNISKIQYEISNVLYVEVELFSDVIANIKVGEKFNNRKVSVIKNSQDIKLLSDIVNNGCITVSGVGSMTVKARF